MAAVTAAGTKAAPRLAAQLHELRPAAGVRHRRPARADHRHELQRAPGPLDAAHDDGAVRHLRAVHARPEHRGRLRRPARPRVRRVLPVRRVHGGLADVGLLLPDRSRHPPVRCDGHGQDARHQHLVLARAADRGHGRGAGRHHHRGPDAAPEVRLPRARHARLRRDPAAGVPQRRVDQGLQPVERDEGHLARERARHGLAVMDRPRRRARSTCSTTRRATTSSTRSA